MLWTLEHQQDDRRREFARCVRRLDDLPEGEKWEERAALILLAGNLGRALDPPQLVPAHLIETRSQFLRRRLAAWDGQSHWTFLRRTVPPDWKWVPKLPRPNATAQAAYFAGMERILEGSKARLNMPLGARLQPPTP